MLKQVLLFTMEPETTKHEMLRQWLVQLQCEFIIGIDLAEWGRIISHIFVWAKMPKKCDVCKVPGILCYKQKLSVSFPNPYPVLNWSKIGYAYKSYWLNFPDIIMILSEVL